VIAVITSNAGKYREFAVALGAAGLRVRRVAAPYPEIQAETLEEVLEHSRGHLDRRVRGDYLADDSGLFIDALAGFPGVYSAHAFRTIGIGGVLRLLRGRPRAARFECRVLVRLGGKHRMLSGTCRGRVAPRPRGRAGFGFDPIFIPEGASRTFAEMSPEEKNAVSHRGRALREVIRYWRQARRS
jgi:XTP/dITP diphosphohydrolase